jgi:hypothetical protein
MYQPHSVALLLFLLTFQLRDNLECLLPSKPFACTWLLCPLLVAYFLFNQGVHKTGQSNWSNHGVHLFFLIEQFYV